MALGLQWVQLMWVRKSHDGFGVLASGRGILMRYYIVLMDLAQGIVLLLFPNYLIIFYVPSTEKKLRVFFSKTGPIFKSSPRATQISEPALCVLKLLRSYLASLIYMKWICLNQICFK